MRITPLHCMVILLMVMIGAIVGLPATVLEWPLRSVSGGLWRFSLPVGTVWKGRTQLVFVGHDGTILPMSSIQWGWQPADLLAGKITWQLYSEGRPAKLTWGFSGWQVDGLSFSMPFAAFAELSPLLKTLGLAGQLKIQVDHFAHQSGEYVGAVKTTWLAAMSRLTPVAPLGCYTFDMTGEGQKLALRVNTLQGVLSIEGKGSWQPGSQLSLSGRAQSVPERYEALKPLMLMFGNSDGQTGVQWRLK